MITVFLGFGLTTPHHLAFNALISSINEVITIHEQGAARRAKAQEELVKLEEELKSAIVGSEKN